MLTLAESRENTESNFPLLALRWHNWGPERRKGICLSSQKGGSPFMYPLIYRWEGRQKEFSSFFLLQSDFPSREWTFACFLKPPKSLMNPQVCPETSDDGPGQPMETCWPFHLPRRGSPYSSCPVKGNLLKWGYFQLCGFHFHFYQVGGVASCGRIRFLLSPNFKRWAGDSASQIRRQQQQQQQEWGRPEVRSMEDQRDLISNHEQLPMLTQRPGAQERYVWAVGESSQILDCTDVRAQALQKEH